MLSIKTSVLHFVRLHKIISGIVALLCIVIAYGGYQLLPASADTTYRVAIVKRDQTIASSVEGTGQVSASSQVSLSAKASGAIVYVGVASGQEVQAGTLIAQIDTRDADISLENARIALQKLTDPADASDITQAEHAVENAQESQVEAYESAYNTISDAFVDITTIVDEYDDILYSRDGYLNDQKALYTNATARQYQDTAGTHFDLAKKEYEQALAQYRTSTRSEGVRGNLSDLIADSYNMVQSMSQAVKDGKLAVDYHLANWPDDYTTEGTATKESLTMWLDETNAHLKNILSAKSAIDSAERSLKEKQDALTNLKNGNDALDVRTQELSLRQKEYDYQDYFIRAPFDGVIANLSVRKYDEVSNGTSIGTFITKDRVAEVSLNEVDIARVKVGQEAALTFDALEGVTATGTVLEVDMVGTAIQGVVSYDVRIGFTGADERIKPGMSVTALITTQKKEGLMTVPSSAIKTSGKTQYVEVLDNVTAKGGMINTTKTTRKVSVTTGISDDTTTEILSGLSGGEVVITGTISASADSSSSSKTNTSIIGGSRSGSGSPPSGGAAVGGMLRTR